MLISIRWLRAGLIGGLLVVALCILSACDGNGSSGGSSSGTLVVLPFTESVITVGHSTTAVVSLSNSSGITTPITVNLASNNPGIISESPTSCNLTTESNYCTVTLTGESAGSGTFTASAVDYESSISGQLTVVMQNFKIVGVAGIINNYNATTSEYSNIVFPKLSFKAIAVNSNGKFVAVGGNGTILTSMNGNTWSAAESSGTTNYLFGVAVNSSGEFVAVGGYGTIVASTDGNNWSSAESSGTTQSLAGVTVNSRGKFVAVGYDGTIVTSTDGNTWISAESSGTTTSLNGVTVNSSGKFVAVGYDGTIVTSMDGNTWTALSPIMNGLTLFAVVAY